jgi:hypothetical protein
VERRCIPIYTLITVAKVLSYIKRGTWLPQAHQKGISKKKFNRRTHLITSNSVIETEDTSNASLNLHFFSLFITDLFQKRKQQLDQIMQMLNLFTVGDIPF